MSNEDAERKQRWEQEFRIEECAPDRDFQLWLLKFEEWKKKTTHQVIDIKEK